MNLNFDAIKSLVQRPQIKGLFDALEKDAKACFLVGGAVRDSLLGLEAFDIDFAVPFGPDETEKRLEMAKIPSVPTGKKHGTISAIIDKKAYEITSMRKDIETDGRFAIVEYCEDISQDAARRDFTINALYCDQEGNLYDPTNHGISDLKAQRLSFVGEPQSRIKEDFLRILRLYRFYSQLRNIEIDSESENAAILLASNMKCLSSERIWAEIKKLLIGPRAILAVEKLVKCGIWQSLFGFSPSIPVLSKYLLCEKPHEINPLTRLLSLMPVGSDIEFCEGLRMSNDEKARFVLREKAFAEAYQLNETIAYLYSKTTAKDVIIANNREDMCEELEKMEAFEPPAFPIKSKELIEFGIEPGPKMGAILKAAEAAWLKRSFNLSKSELHEIILNFDTL